MTVKRKIAKVERKEQILSTERRVKGKNKRMNRRNHVIEGAAIEERTNRLVNRRRNPAKRHCHCHLCFSLTSHTCISSALIVYRSLEYVGEILVVAEFFFQFNFFRICPCPRLVATSKSTSLYLLSPSRLFCFKKTWRQRLHRMFSVKAQLTG